MELKEAEYLDYLLKRANSSVINIDGVDGEAIDILIDRDLIEIVDKRHGVDPYLIKISPRGRDFMAAGGFVAEVENSIGKKAEENERIVRKAREDEKEKIEERKRHKRLILDDASKIVGILAAIGAIVFGIIACL